MRIIQGKVEAVRQHRCPSARIAEDPLARCPDESFRIVHPTPQGLWCGLLYLGGSEVLLGVCMCARMDVGISLSGKITGRGLIELWGVMMAQRGDVVGRWTVVPVRIGVHEEEGEETVGFYPNSFFFSCSELQHRVRNKINLNSSVLPIHFLPAKLSIPSNPHLFIIALSCASKN